MTTQEMNARINWINEHRHEFEADYQIDLDIEKGELEAALMADQMEEFRYEMENPD